MQRSSIVERPPWRNLAWWLFVISLGAGHIGVWLGNAGAIGLLGCWLLYGALWPARAIRAAAQSFWPWALPCLALASTLWSVQPALSFRQGCEFLLFTEVGLLMGSSLRPRAIVSAVMAGMVAVAVGGLLDGTRAVVQHAGSTAATGGLGSKNTFALVGSLLFLSASCCCLDRRQGRLMRMVAAFCVPLSLGILAMTRSDGAIETTAIAAVIALPMSLAERMHRRWRGAVLALCAVAALAAAGAAFALAWSIGTDQLLAAIGKDAGLSGRAFLWQRAAELIGERPLAGVGYQAFWVQETLDAEGLWRGSGIASRYGFHFHSLYYETAVELGLIGVAVLSATLVTTLFRVLYWTFFISMTEASFFLSLMIVLLARSYGEMDFLFPIADGTEFLPMMFAAATLAKSRGVIALHRRLRDAVAA